MNNEIVVANVRLAVDSSITYVRDASGIIATFPYDQGDAGSVMRRYLDFFNFVSMRSLVVVDVIGDVVQP
jgi:spore coat polysaccharide biosynthesis protein SpsF (cytidylyltransferase family)